MSLLQAGKPVEAIVEFRSALKDSPKDVELMLGLALALRTTNKLSEAIVVLKDAVAISPRRGDLYYELGATYSSNNQHELAVQNLEVATDLLPYRSRPWQSLGASLAMLKRYDESVAAYERSIGYEPDDFLPHFGLAQLYADQDKWELAAREYQAINHMRPEFRPAWTGLLSAYNSLKQYDRALSLAEQILKTNADDLDIVAGYAIALDGVDRQEDAIKQYKIILAKNGNNPLIWGNFGWSQYGAGKYADAIISTRKAISLDPKLAYVKFNLGLIYAVQGDSVTARKEYAEAIKIAIPSDYKGPLDDVRDALKKQPESKILKETLLLLQGK